MEPDAAWRKQASVETSLSAFGAGFLGVGIGLILGVRQPAFGWVLAAAGLGAHALGMVFLHRRFQGHATGRPAWLEAAYWACWAVLLAVIGLVGWWGLR